MKIRYALAAVAAMAVTFGAAFFFSLPADREGRSMEPIPASEHQANLEALKPPKRKRPLVAVVAINDATETTDFLMPIGILRRSGVMDVVSIATSSSPVKLFPALTAIADTTYEAFDARHPDGADYVVVPQMSRPDDPTVLRWLRAQSAKGAVIIGVCAGARIVAQAGLLDGKRATTHWYYLSEMLKKHPGIQYVPNRRFVVDQGVATTTGVTASMPMMLTLIEAVAGRERAERVAAQLNVSAWGAEHGSGAFGLTRSFASTVAFNRAQLWRHDRLGIPLRSGIDEVSLALVADAWSRTYRSRALTFSLSAAPQPSQSGIPIIPDHIQSRWNGGPEVKLAGLPQAALDSALRDIAARYGEPTANVVAQQLEYPRPHSAPPRKS